jgi:hypothetical protein
MKQGQIPKKQMQCSRCGIFERSKLNFDQVEDA